MTSEREYLFYLQDMEDSMRHIFEFTKGLDFSTFKKNRLVVDAVIRNFEIIGEASKNVSIEFKKNFSNMPWKEIAGMRDKLIHHYMGVDIDVIWKTVKQDIPFLAKELKATK